MVDSSVVKAHQDSMRSSEPKEAAAIGRSRGGLSTKIHLACDGLGYPLAFILTGGERGDATQATALLRKTIKKDSACLLDCGYDSDAIRTFIVQSGGTAVIPQHPNRAGLIPMDKHIYKERHKVENLFQKLKRFRRIASRFEMKTSHYAAMLSIACVLLWLKA